MGVVLQITEEDPRPAHLGQEFLRSELLGD